MSFDFSARSGAGAIGALAPLVSPYHLFAIKSFRKQLAYRFEYFVGMLNGLLFIFIFTSLWRSIYANSSIDQSQLPFDSDSIISYAIYAMIIRISLTQDESPIPTKVRAGLISLDMIKPINFIVMSFAEALGHTMFHWVARSIPIFIVTLIFFDARAPFELDRIAIGAFSMALGYLILFFINFCFAALSFWFIENFSFQLMKFGLITLFAGGIAPIDFFPRALQGLIRWIPFQHIIYTPTTILIGAKSISESLEALLIQSGWVLTLALCGALMWRFGQHKIVSQGG